MDRPTAALDRRYAFEYEVGLWTYGKVYVLTERQTGRQKVCKSVEKACIPGMHGAMGSETFRRLQGLRRLSHPHICAVSDVQEDQQQIFVIMDHCGGGDVAEWMVRVLEQGYWLQEATVVEYVRQLLLAVSHSHANGVCHRDLRPSSLALTSKLPDADVKICDLGVAAILSAAKAPAPQPTPYTAPELLHGATAKPDADVWSVGAIAHALLVGQPPDSSSMLRLGPGLIACRAGDMEDWGSRSKMSLHFVQTLLRPAGDRPTAALALQHPWLKGAVDLGPPSPEEPAAKLLEDARGRLVCYELAALSLPRQLQPGDFGNFRAVFQQADKDGDGLVCRGQCQRLLEGRGLLADAAAAALHLADVRGDGCLDLCGALCADVLAGELQDALVSTGSLTEAGALARQLARRFLGGCSEGGKDSVASVQVLAGKLASPAARDVEHYTGLRYSEVLACLPAAGAVDAAALLNGLALSAGRGTPLELGGIGAAGTLVGWQELLGGLDNLGSFIQSVVRVLSTTPKKADSLEPLSARSARVWGGA